MKLLLFQKVGTTNENITWEIYELRALQLRSFGSCFLW